MIDIHSVWFGTRYALSNSDPKPFYGTGRAYTRGHLERHAGGDSYVRTTGWNPQCESRLTHRAQSRVGRRT